MKDSVNIFGGLKVNIIVCSLFFCDFHVRLFVIAILKLLYFISLIRTGE